MRVPTSTYRLQITPDTPLMAAARAVPYLDRLGVGDLYSSPLLASSAGSGHGYDVIDPLVVDPQRGGDEGFEAFAEALARHGMGLLLDIVPNHMGASMENPYWRDLLVHGPASEHSSVFDIDWAAGGGRITLPVLGSLYGEIIDQGELQLALRDDAIEVHYHEHRFPTDPGTWGTLVRGVLNDPPGPVRGATGPLGALADAADRIGGRSGSARPAAARRRRAGRARELLDRLPPPASRLLEDGLARLGGRPDELDAFLEAQPYRLAWWRSASHEMTYRRFFDITDLAAVRVEDPAVFDLVHRRVLELAKGAITGLRIDHIDGLRDPAGYLERLRSVLPDPEPYVLVEKILERHEQLPEGWACAGETGYAFADVAEGLFVDAEGAERLARYGDEVSGDPRPFEEVVAEAKRHVLVTLFGGEVDTLARRIHTIARGDRRGRDVALPDVRDAVIAISVALPVYRTYISSTDIAPADRLRVSRAVEEAVSQGAVAAELVGRVLLGGFGGAGDHLDVVMRWQQLTGPAMAKGFEDTALYRWVRLASRNDVGGHPDAPAVDPEDVHAWMAERAQRWPAALNAGTTHDSKRSEDVRARIHVLSEIPERWEAAHRRWCEMNAPLKPEVGGRPAPDASEEHLLYQTLVGTWPLDGSPLRELRDRIAAYMRKALREAKRNTSWREPNDAWEEAVEGFIGRLFGRRGAAFREELANFTEGIAPHAASNSLAALVLRCAAPGVPDVYQGTELWTLTLVDPDNRRPVDLEHRARLLTELDEAYGRDPAALCSSLAEGWRDGRIKLHVTAQALRLRRERPALFTAPYEPLKASGRAARHLFAFARGDELVAVVPRLPAALGDGLPIGGVWGRTSIELPGAGTFRDVLTGEVVEARDGRASVRQVLRLLPVALLVRERR